MTDDGVQFVEVVTEHLLPCSDDLILLTLKGHLVAEHLLETILTRALAVSELPKEKDARLTFFQKLKLVEAAVCARPPRPNADLFCAVAKLNSVRNQLAHNLKNQGEVEKDIRSLIESYCAKAGERPDESKPFPEQLRNCLCKLCVFLFRVRRHIYDLAGTPSS